MPSKKLSVRLYGLPVGVLEQTETGRLQYQYAENAQQALSLNMPLSDQVYKNSACEAFFGGLLPESEHVRNAIARRYGISANNTFSLLRVIGYDCAGAVSIVDPDDPIVDDEWHEIIVKPLDDNELAKHIEELPTRPLFIGLEGMRLSLAGAQAKAGVIVRDGNIGLPKNRCPTTHILKPEIPGYPGSAQNEYLCMRLAKSMGLPVPEVQIKQANDVIFLLVDRYDREIADNRVRRIHQEDFCQALGVQSSAKYQREGGPTFKNCFSLMLNTTMPGANRNALMQILVFNILIGNTDAHGKNFSLLYPSPDIIGLAPFYDLLSTLSYPELSKEMAMKVGSTYFSAAITRRDFERLCADTDYAFPALRQTIMHQVESLPELAVQERTALSATNYDHEIADCIVDVINQSCSRIKEWLGS